MLMDRWQYENYMESIEKKMKKQTSNQNVTNADRVRSMSDEELARFINSECPRCNEFCDDFCSGCAYNCNHNHGEDVILQWLKKEADY